MSSSLWDMMLCKCLENNQLHCCSEVLESKTQEKSQLKTDLRVISTQVDITIMRVDNTAQGSYTEKGRL